MTDTAPASGVTFVRADLDGFCPRDWGLDYWSATREQWRDAYRKHLAARAELADTVAAP